LSVMVPASQRITLRKVTTGLRGQVTVPGDKSISHRAAILGAIADGTTRIRNFLPANDCLATLDVVRGLGINVEYGAEEVLVHGRGLHGLREPLRPLECGGSGTTMRLMSGLLAGQPFYSVLSANAQLGKRPMDRVAMPLRAMGATILGREGGKYAPLSIAAGSLMGIRYEMPVASAQVKSALLLAGLFAEGRTEVVEPAPSRDHTERMLLAMGANVTLEGNVVGLKAPPSLNALDVQVPGDISSAAFLMAAAAIVPGSRIVLPGVGLNPGRVGIINVLKRMGAVLRLHNERLDNGEPVADIEIEYSARRGTQILPEEVPGLIDELPILAVIATQAEGVTEVRGAAELRVKETDRIATTVGELRRLGAKIEALPDGFIVEGPMRLHGATVSSQGDHRLAMSLAVAGLVADGETTVDDTACVADSFPGFEQTLAAVGVIL
jgi:3-phosphoshikimate 1-carboxyvinyltransferase